MNGCRRSSFQSNGQHGCRALHTRRRGAWIVLAVGVFFLGIAIKGLWTGSISESACSQAGGTYSSGSNYARCEYSNGDSYTCNTDVNQCESCTNGNCTVSARRHGMPLLPPSGGMNAQPPKPTPPKPALPLPAPTKQKIAQ